MLIVDQAMYGKRCKSGTCHIHCIMYMGRTLCNVSCDRSSSYDGICPVSDFPDQNTINRGKEKDAFTWHLSGSRHRAAEVKVTVVGGHGGCESCGWELRSYCP